MKPKVIIIGGPTASGKTGLSIKLAQKLNTEIISCDSMQIYKYMDIGTAKPTEEEKEGIEHYMLDIVEPDENFSVSKYIEMVKPIIKDITQKGKIPILVGGTGLYVDTLINNIELPESKVDYTYREMLEERARLEGNENIYEMLKEIDPQACEKIHLNDTKRIIRALEIYHTTGKTITECNIESRKNEPEYDYYLFGIEMDREKLYERINKRVDIMLEQGLVEEVKKIHEKYNSFPTAMQALGYKEVVKYLNNEYTYDQMVETLKMETRRYAKRQLTWFRRYDNMKWFDYDNMSINSMIEQICNIVKI